jgi:hypothetical protein
VEQLVAASHGSDIPPTARRCDPGSGDDADRQPDLRSGEDEMIDEPQGLLPDDQTRDPDHGEAGRRLDHQHSSIGGIRDTGVPYATYYAIKAAMIT